MTNQITPSRQIIDEVTSWPGVTAGPGKRGVEQQHQRHLPAESRNVASPSKEKRGGGGARRAGVVRGTPPQPRRAGSFQRRRFFLSSPDRYCRKLKRPYRPTTAPPTRKIVPAVPSMTEPATIAPTPTIMRATL